MSYFSSADYLATRLKKLIAIGLVLTYLITLSGLALSIHFCGGKLREVRLLPTKSDKNCGCSMPKPNKSCCKTHKLLIKIKDVHQTAAKSLTAKIIHSTLALPTKNHCSVLSSPIKHFAPTKVPPDEVPSLYLRHCSFRI